MSWSCDLQRLIEQAPQYSQYLQYAPLREAYNLFKQYYLPEMQQYLSSSIPTGYLSAMRTGIEQSAEQAIASAGGSKRGLGALLAGAMVRASAGPQISVAMDQLRQQRLANVGSLFAQMYGLGLQGRYMDILEQQSSAYKELLDALKSRLQSELNSYSDMYHRRWGSMASPFNRFY